MATFDLIVVAAAFDRWRMRGSTSERARVRRSQATSFQRPRLPSGPTVGVEVSKPYKARSVSGEGGLEVKGATVPMCALITLSRERRTDV